MCHDALTVQTHVGDCDCEIHAVVLSDDRDHLSGCGDTTTVSQKITGFFGSLRCGCQIGKLLNKTRLVFPMQGTHSAFQKTRPRQGSGTGADAARFVAKSDMVAYATQYMSEAA